MPRRVASKDQNLSRADVASIVSALLESIRRSELRASLREVEFLVSVARILEPGVGTTA